jgi:phage protein D
LQTRHERSFDNITLGNLVKTLAAEHGLEAVVEASLAAVNLGHVDQTNESNISLLSRLSRDIGGVVKPTYGKLVVAKTGSGKSVSGLAMPRITLPKSDLSSWEIGFAARPAFVSVECQFHDVGSATPGTYSVSSSTTTSVPKFRLNRMMADLPEASRTARALLDRFQREGQTFEVTLPGRTDILAETVIELDGMRKRLVGPWLVTRAVHTLGRGGYTVSASGEAFFG